MNRPAIDTLRPFKFEIDSFAFANELVWQYRFDPISGKTTNSRTVPPPDYAHRCFVMVRSARQFLYHAIFNPDQPRIADLAYAALIREVVSRSPRHASPPGQKIVLPGFASLREFSAAHEALLKANCGGAWQSYFLRSHWRMVFPISRAHQASMATQLQAAIESGGSPIVHLVTFPQLTINHGILLFAGKTESSGTVFDAYDPNIPDRPIRLIYDATTRSFEMPGTHYWSGGRLDVIHVYQGWFY